MISIQDIKKISKSTLANTIYQVISIAVTLSLTPLMIMHLGNYYYGIWIFSTIIVSYYGYADLGITSAVTRNMGVSIGEKDNEKFNKIFANGLLLNCAIGLILVLITLVAFFIMNNIKIVNQDLHSISKITLILGMNFALSFPARTFYSIIIANIRFEILSIIQAIQLILNMILTRWLLKQGHGIISLAYIMLFCSFITNILFIIFGFNLAKFIRFKINLINKTNILGLLHYGSKTIVSQIADLMKTRIDEIVIGATISINLVTTYSIANRIIGASNNLNSSFYSTATSLCSKYYGINSLDDNKKLFFFLSKISFSISFFVLFCLLFAGNGFITLWVGKNYQSSYTILVILAFACFYDYIQAVGLSFIYAKNKHQYWSIVSIIEGILNLALSLFFALTLKMGIYGIALGTLASRIIAKTSLQSILVSKMLQIKLKDYGYAFFKNLIIGFVVFSCSGLILKFFNINYFSIFGIVFTIIYFLLITVLFFIIILNEQEKSFFLSKIREQKALKESKT